MFGDVIKKIMLIIAALFLVAGVILVIATSLSGRKEDKTEFYSEDEKQLIANGNNAIKESKTVATTEATTEYIVSPSEENADETGEEEKVAKNNMGAGSLGDGVDRSAPIILISNNAIVPQFTQFDIHKYIGYADDVDRDVTLNVNGEVDTSRLGSYELTFSLTDDAGHVTNSKISVDVVENDLSPSSADDDGGGAATGPGESFSTFMSKYGNENTSLGLDVSRWQGNIDFQKVKDAGCDFVIIRLGGYDDKSHYTDRCYNTYIRDAKAVGLKVGVYWHAEESTTDEVKNSVNYLLDVLGNETLDFPIAYDWEDFGNFESYGMNLYDINECYNVFYNQLKLNGYDVCLYSSKRFLEGVWTNDVNSKIWLAHYTSATNYSGNYFMWQHASNGRIDGIATYVDFNVLYLDR